MFERFDTAARRVVILAQDEARKLNHHTLDTQHVLLGLHRESHGVAAKALTSLGIDYDAIFALVQDGQGRGAEPTSGHIPFTEAVERAMEYSLEESLELRHDSIGPEHMLLALVRDQNNASRMLAAMGADGKQVRERVLS